MEEKTFEGTEMNEVNVSGNDIVPAAGTDLIDAESDGNAALGIAILVGGGALLGVAAKTGFDFVKRKITEHKEAKPEKEKKPGFFSKFKKEKDAEPEVVADAEAKEIEEPKEETSKEESEKEKTTE